MDPNTLTLYLIASAWSFCLSLLLLVVARLKPTSGLIRDSVLAILLLSVGLMGSGFGPMLPRWTTVVGTNLILLSVGLVTSVFCAKVFAANLPADERLQAPTLVAASATTTKVDDAAAARALRAFIAGQRPAGLLATDSSQRR